MCHFFYDRDSSEIILAFRSGAYTRLGSFGKRKCLPDWVGAEIVESDASHLHGFAKSGLGVGEGDARGNARAFPGAAFHAEDAAHRFGTFQHRL